MTARTRSLRLEGLEARDVPAAVGALDPSFGTAGLVTTTFGGLDAGAAVAVQADGKVVVVGSTSTDTNIAVARYNPDGSLDATFAGDGTTLVNFGTDETASAVAIQDDGKIVVVGSATDGAGLDFLVARLNPDGTLDTTFSGDGLRTFGFDDGATDDDRATGVAIQGTGAGRRIVVVGTTDQSDGGEFTNFGVVRLSDTGSLVSSANFTLGGTEEARGVAIDSAGRIVVVGHTDVGGGIIPGNLAVIRLLSDGTTLDTNFDTDGMLTVDIGGGNDEAAGVVIEPDDRIVVAGTVVGAGSNFILTRLNPDGTPDASFSGDGEAVFSIGGVDTARGVALQGDGRIVVVGTTDTGATPDDLTVVRLNPDGTLDTSFDGDGRATVNFGGSDQGAGVAIDANGRIVVAGRTSVLNDFAVARLIGSVEKGDVVAVGGELNAAAAVFDPTAAGMLPAAPSAAVAAFGPGAANVRTAVGDVNGDGFDDTILATGPGVPLRVAVVSGADDVTLLVAPFAPFSGSEDFAGGGFVSAGDFDGDGRAEFVVSPDVSGGPRVTVFGRNADGSTTVRANFFGIDDPAFRGGARTAIGDVNGDGTPDLAVAAGFSGGPRTALFDGTTLFGTPTRLVADFFAFPGADAVSLRNGAFVAAGDVDGDGFAELVFGGGPGGAPRVFALGGALVAAGNVAGAQAAPVANFFVAGDAADRGGVRVAVADLDGDHRADLLAGSGEGRAAALRAYLGANVTGSAEPATFQDVSLFGGLSLTGGVFVG